MLKILLVLIVFLSVSTFSIAQNTAKKIDDLMKQYNLLNQFDGTVLIADKDKIILKKGYGLANREWQIPNSTNTKFRIGSITKQFTSFIIFQLAQEGKLKIEGKITDYLTDYRNDTGSKVSIYQLLTHTSGIPDWDNENFFPEKARNRYESDYFIKTFLSGDLAFEPSTKFNYSNGDYFLLGKIIEKVTNKSWEVNLQERILTPLKMKNTGVDLSKKVLTNKALGYVKDGPDFIGEPYIDLQNYYSAGAMYSTAEDLFLWFQSFENEKLLLKKYREIMFKGLEDKGFVACGSWVYRQSFGKNNPQLIERSGSIKGFQSHTIRTDDGKTLIFLSNNEAENLYGKSHNVLNILYNQPAEKPK